MFIHYALSFRETDVSRLTPPYVQTTTSARLLRHLERGSYTLRWASLLRDLAPLKRRVGGELKSEKSFPTVFLACMMVHLLN